VYNGEAFIAEAIASVHAQTYGNWQLFVVDDCSSDGSVREVQKWCDRDPRIKVLRTPGNAGSSAARNLGLSHCTGRYVAFLDADDAWVAAKLEKQLTFMTSLGAGFSFTAYRKFGARGLGGVVGADASVSWRDMLKGNRIGCSTVMLDTRVFPRIWFPTGLGRQEDYALWLSLLRGDGPAYGLDEPLVLYRVHATSKSARKLRSVMAQWRVYRDLEKLSRPVAAWYMAHYAFRGVLKALL
jgi:glycosyltransferase involved in cell wall biosynthesis